MADLIPPTTAAGGHGEKIEYVTIGGVTYRPGARVYRPGAQDEGVYDLLEIRQDKDALLADTLSYKATVEHNDETFEYYVMDLALYTGGASHRTYDARRVGDIELTVRLSLYGETATTLAGLARNYNTSISEQLTGIVRAEVKRYLGASEDEFVVASVEPLEGHRTNGPTAPGIETITISLDAPKEVFHRMAENACAFGPGLPEVLAEWVEEEVAMLAGETPPTVDIDIPKGLLIDTKA